MSALERQLQGYRLTTAEILYRLPDHPHLLQTFVWQELDLLPDLPVLTRFLKFWERTIEGRLHSVRVSTLPIISPGETRFITALAHIH
jgi:uncharacterized protein Usg